MMHLELDRILEGVIGQLREIAAATDDTYSRAQLQASAEVLANLQTRVSWRPDYRLGWVAKARSVITDAVTADAAGELARAREALRMTDELDPDYTRLHARALSEVRTWLRPRAEGTGTGPHNILLARTDALISAELDDELQRLRR